MRNTLIIMLKEPRAGRVKTRLGREMGMASAANWFRSTTSALLRRVGFDPRWHTVLAIAPDNAVDTSSFPAIGRWPQGQGDLGDRMKRAMVAHGPGSVVVIGGDAPQLGARQISRAFAALRGSDAVFGPAPDGGYWLIGLRRVPATLFEQVRWSTEYALSDTIASLPKSWTVATLETLRDVDTLADLRIVEQELQHRSP